ncbi:hypothetical protein ACFO0N_09270 [Halobium salinum]|uniref:Energy transducer TonB n=1 Tax=Halobium salinum TaxID=1364940 RepID=A0ABD5PBV1_9EURY|nr:hypothetical protein [Halobium salinum]
MVSKKTLAFTLVGLFVAASLVHYALFGSFPFGKPQLLDEEETEADEAAA